MKVIITGSRSIHSYVTVEQAIIDSGFDDIDGGIEEVVSGAASGVDSLGEEWAYKNHRKLKLFPADWSNGLGAGYTRNSQMASYADALIAVHDGVSKGTANMIEQAKKRKLKVFVYEA